MKRILCVFLTLLLLTACAAQPQEISQGVPVSEPVTLDPDLAVPDSKPSEPEFSPVNPYPASYVSLEAGDRVAYLDGRTAKLPAAPFVEHDAFYFPLQFVAEAMGVEYAFADGCAYLRYDGHITQFFVNSPRFIVDGVEGRVEGERRLYREGLPQGPVDMFFKPVLRNGAVFLPVEYLPAAFRRAYNSFGAQMCPDRQQTVRFENNLFPTETGPALAVTLCPNAPEALVNGERTPLPAAPFVENDVFYFPVETVAQWMGVGFSRSGDTFWLFNSSYDTRFYLNTRDYVMNGRIGERDGTRRAFTSRDYVPVDDTYVPVERDGVIFLPSDYMEGVGCCFWYWTEYTGYSEAPEPGMVIIENFSIPEDGLGGFYLGQTFDETAPELRAGLQCTSTLGEFGEYDIVGYTGGGLTVHVLRLRPGEPNSGQCDGTVAAVFTTNPAIPTPRGLRCGDTPRRAWELYAYGPMGFRFSCPDNGPITIAGFVRLTQDQVTTPTGAPYDPIPNEGLDFHDGPFLPDEWLSSPPFWQT